MYGSKAYALPCFAPIGALKGLASIHQIFHPREVQYGLS